MIYRHQSSSAIDPNRWLYAKWYKGDEVSVRQYNNIVKNYIDHTIYKIQEQTCRATNHIAVSANLLTRRQRDKYASRRAWIGKHTFYYFSRDQLPLDVLSAIDFADDQYIYIKID